MLVSHLTAEHWGQRRNSRLRRQEITVGLTYAIGADEETRDSSMKIAGSCHGCADRRD